MCAMSSKTTSKNTTFWSGKRVLVTGGTGFLGSFVVDELIKRGARVTATTRLATKPPRTFQVIEGDLTNQTFVNQAVQDAEVVIHLASKVAGIQYNVDHPVEMFNETIQMAKNVLESSHHHKVERIFLASSACVYPRFCTIPTPESEGFIDDPEPTNLGYGWAKRVIELMGRFYHMEYGLKVAVARPYNLYGPRDQFDPTLSHVIPGLIKRVLDGENPLIVWGSGTQTRSFLYVEDCARGIVDLTEHSTNAEPVNLGADEEISIADLTRLIVELSGTKTEITFDTTKPDGQPRRSCDTTRAHKLIGFKPRVNLREGLAHTIQWFKHHSSS